MKGVLHIWHVEMAAESGEPVVISCTGATASRNYMPGLTEAFYRKLPILAITSHRGEAHIGHHPLTRQIDRRTIPNDVAVKQVTIPMVDAPEDERFCEIEVTKAIIALKKNWGVVRYTLTCIQDIRLIFLSKTCRN